MVMNKYEKVSDVTKLKSLKILGRDIAQYTITYEATEQPSVVFAAEELQKYLCQSVDVTVDIVTGGVGDNPAIRLVYDKDMGDNYSIKTVEAGLVISGGKRGVLYGVYNFLEDHLGWMFLPYDTDVLLAESENIEIGDLNYEYKQYFEYRAPYFTSAHRDNLYAAKNMVNYSGGFEKGREGDNAHLGGFFGFTGGFAHTFAALVGEGTLISSNPCMYDEKVYNKIHDGIMKMLAEKPDTQIVSVSANDSSKFCDCDKCSGRSVGGNRTDGVLGLVNRIAEEVEKKYPNVKIHTLAYGPTRDIPKVNMPRDNVIIQLCSMGCCFEHPIEERCTDANKIFMHQLKAWSKISDNLYIWDYVTNYRYFLTTFPNLGVLRANVRTFLEHNTKGMFEQGDVDNYYTKGEVLMSYVLAKIMKNPYMTDEEYDRLINRFLRGYYGEGWEYIRAYYDFLSESSRKKQHFGIYATPECMYAPEDFIERGAEVEYWFDAAIAAATDDKTHYHLRTLRISFTYMRLYLTYDHIMKNGTEREIAKLKAECADTFDKIVEEGYRLVDVHPPIAEMIKTYKLNKTAHPIKWCTSEHRMPPSMCDHGMFGDENFFLAGAAEIMGDDIYG